MARVQPVGEGGEFIGPYLPPIVSAAPPYPKRLQQQFEGVPARPYKDAAESGGAGRHTGPNCPCVHNYSGVRAV
ncbi:hypothetical protein ACQEU8_01220 [Streptomyces sp. CA-250714]|uniref:hypothetical protein n=1 Tax=Streptomyces sp. CA-250714 TaxID=3240060 RepID=UPI003D945A8C